MIWTLIAVLFAGMAGAGIGLALRKLSGNRLPGGLPPVLAGVLMLVATVGQEYAWYPNNLDDLPADVVVLSEREQQAAWQPWTYVQPWVRGFIAFSPAETVETAEASGIFAVQVHMRERWQPEIIRPVLVDCTGMRRGDMTEATVFGADGQPEGVTWREAGPDDPVVDAVCTAEAPAS